MKSSFIFTLVVTALMANVASAQILTKPSAAELAAQQKTSFQKFSDRLKIGYFGVLTTPTISDIEKGNYEYAATSNATSTYPGNRDSLATNMWNQISFNFNFGAKMNFVVNPRFSVPLYSVSSADPGADTSLIQVEDALVGFQGVVYASEDKKFNLWIRPGMRLPTSRASRTAGSFGNVTQNLELAYLPTYDFNKTWQLGLFGQFRTWIYEDHYNQSRFRYYTAPYVQYTIDDTTRLQVYYESMIETNKRWESVNDKKPVYKDIWQNVMVGVNKDINSDLNIFPYLSMFVDDAGPSNKSVWIGAWISYKIK